MWQAADGMESWVLFSPKMFPVDHGHRIVRGLEIIQQARVHGNSPCLAIPLPIRCECGAVGIQVAPAGAAKVVGDELGLPPVDGVTVGLCDLEYLRIVIGVEVAPLRAN